MLPYLIMSVALGAAPDASQSATPDYKQVMQSGLAFLDADGAKLEKDASCINCHHAPLRGWALKEALRLELPVDANELRKTTDSQLDQLLEVEKSYQSKQWGHSLSMFYVLAGVDDKAQDMPQNVVDELARIILAEQAEDGSWKAAQQFGNQRRPAKDANEVQTMWGVLALSELGSREAAVAARAKAIEWLKNAPPGTTIDARVLRLVIEQRFGTHEQAQRLLSDLLKSQHADGGWGWQPDDASEAWPTGMALYAFSLLGDDAPVAEIARARKFLAQTQQEDGSWFVEGKLTKNSAMSSYFGTVWAIIGIARTEPHLLAQKDAP